MRILVVENSRRMQDALKYALDPFGEVQLAGSASEAIHALQSGSPVDIVFTDYHMRGRSGIELIDYINSHHDELPVVLLTAYGTKELTIEALNRRVFRFLEKPIQYGDLKQIIDQVTSLREKTVRDRRVRDLGLLSNLVFHEIGGGLQDLLSEAQSMDLSGIQEDSLPELAGRFLQIRDTIFQTSNAFRNLKFLISEDRELSGVLVEEDLIAIVGRIAVWLSSYTETARVSATFNLPKNSIKVRCLEGMIERAVKNVLINALEAIDRAGQPGVIEVSTELSASHCQLSIRNSGPAIPEEIREKIFDYAISSQKQGPIPRGIGLYVVHQVMRVIGGQVSVDSDNHWTTFKLNFPLATS